MDRKRKIFFQYSLIGACAGYFFFHPLVMLLSFLMSVRDAPLGMINTTAISTVIMRSFSIDMLPWSLSFTLFNGIIGFYYGILKFRKLEQEELIISLQKALEEVKTLSGLLPICAWCKKIRSDEGYWQNIETYLKSHSDLDFTHGICSDCAQKEYPELYPKKKDKMDNVKS